MRADIDVELRGRNAFFLAQTRDGLLGDARDHAAPPRMHHRERARGSHDDHGDAIGEAQKRRGVGACDDHAVGPLRRAIGALLRIARIAAGHDDIAVDLMRLDAKGVGRAERRKQGRLVLLHMDGVVADVAAQVQRIVRGEACAARALREADANARRGVERIIGYERA